MYNNGGANNTSLAWGAGYGVQDQPGPAAGGGVQSSGGVAIDSTAIYTPSKVNLSDGQVHTLSEYVTAVSGLGTGDKPLAARLPRPDVHGFQRRLLVHLRPHPRQQHRRIPVRQRRSTATSIDNTKPTGTINDRRLARTDLHDPGDGVGELQGDVLADRLRPDRRRRGDDRPGSGLLHHLGPDQPGHGVGRLTGFRTATNSGFTGHVRFDNFADPISAVRVGPRCPRRRPQPGRHRRRRQHVHRRPGRQGSSLSGNLLGTQSNLERHAIHPRRRRRKQRRLGGRPDDQPACRQLLLAELPGHGRERQPAQPDVYGDLYRRHDRNVHSRA